MSDAGQTLEALLKKRKQEGRLRSLLSNDQLTDFCSNDYLGFARNPLLAQLAERLMPDDPQRINGSGGSRLIRGNSAYAEKMEQQIACFHHAEAALLFNSGYDANLGFFSSVPQRTDTVLYDRLIHASIRDGIRLSGARAYGFRHNDVEDLLRLKDRVSGNVFVAVESVYSMDGDLAPLQAISEVCRKQGWHLVVDEAHAIGIFGQSGEGRVNRKLAADCFARIYTYGKAMGAHGAAIVGTSVLREYLINFARSFIYTTALPTHSIALIEAAYQLLREDASARAQLHELINYFQVNKPGHLNINSGASAIQTLITTGNENTMKLAGQLRNAGLDVRAILSPTVPAGQERLRISLHAFNSTKEIGSLIELLNRIPIDSKVK
jgi:8-amino-7-oxononanoate synthase